MFEPIGKSAPKYAGKNIFNPLACIGAIQMMLEHLGKASAAKKIKNAIRKVVANDIKNLAVGEMGHSTKEVGDLVAGYIQNSD